LVVGIDVGGTCREEGEEGAHHCVREEVHHPEGRDRRRRHLRRLEDVEDRVRLAARAHGGAAQRGAHGRHLGRRHPPLGDEDLQREGGGRGYTTVRRKGGTPPTPPPTKTLRRMEGGHTTLRRMSKLSRLSVCSVARSREQMYRQYDHLHGRSVGAKEWRPGRLVA